MMLSVCTLARQLAAGETTSVQIVQDCLNVIDRHNPRLNALIEVFAQEALEAAAQSDARRRSSQHEEPRHRPHAARAGGG